MNAARLRLAGRMETRKLESDGHPVFADPLVGGSGLLHPGRPVVGDISGPVRERRGEGERILEERLTFINVREPFRWATLAQVFLGNEVL
jgi:hypothetical protein